MSSKVTVLMPVYNSEEFVGEAIESILNQSFQDFKLLIINDGSTDNSDVIINQYKNKKIQIIHNKQNLGIIKTLNKGLDLISESEYIVRMDSDDISLPNRLEKQVSFMDKHPEVAVSGTSISMFNNIGKTVDKIVSSDSRVLRTKLLFNNPLMHPSVIMRNSILKLNNFYYDESFEAAEDYGLWQKIARNYDLSNVADVLLRYRDNEFGITNMADKEVEKRDNVHILIYKEMMNSWGITLTPQELVMWREFNSGRINLSDKRKVLELNELIKKIKNGLDQKYFDLESFNERCSFRYRTAALNYNIGIIKAFKIYSTNYKSTFKFSLLDKSKFILKKIMRYVK